jgi:hypothetical protein
MSFISRLFFGSGGGALPLALSNGAPHGTALVSPWQEEGRLAHVAYSELYAGASDVVDRNVAMTVAPVKRGRAVIVGKLADLPLEAGRFDGDNFVLASRQPAWLSNTNTNFTCWHRMALTLDDLIFYGWSLWALERTETGTITDALRVAQDRWEFDKNTALGIRVNGEEVTDPSSVILFAGPDEGLLKTGADVIRGAKAIERGWIGRAQNPIPAMVLHEVSGAAGGGSRITAAQAQEYVELWAEARTSPNGAIGFLPANLQMEVYGTEAPDMYESARNANRLDVANLLNLPASVLDGSTAEASLTYTTQEGTRQELVEWLEFWLAPIESRLSKDDVTPHGQVIRFNRSNLIRVPNQTHGPDLPESDASQE